MECESEAKQTVYALWSRLLCGLQLEKMMRLGITVDIIWIYSNNHNNNNMTKNGNCEVHWN